MSNNRRIVRKANKPTLLNTLPNQQYGSDGDITLSSNNSFGTLLSVKSKNQWWSVKLKHLKDLDNNLFTNAEFTGKVKFSKKTSVTFFNGFKTPSDIYLRNSKIYFDMSEDTPNDYITGGLNTLDFYTNGTKRLAINDSSLELSGSLKIGSVSSGTGSLENFLVIAGTEVKKRTAAQVRSDLGISDDEIIDWTTDQGDTNIHTGNYTDTNTNQLTEFTLTGDSGSNQTIAYGNTLDISGGTNCTTVVGATDTVTVNVDDAFLVNDASDTTTGTITAGGFTTTGTWTFDDATSGTVGITTVHTGSSFTDNDTSLMTAGAIKEKIEDYGYTTNDGDITGVTITTDSGGGSKAQDTEGRADFSILGSNGVGVTNSGTTITAQAVPGEIDHDSLNNFAANEHIDWTASSAGTIHSTNYTNTTYSVMASGNSYAAGLVAAGSGTHSNQFLRKDGTWVVPENDNTTYTGGTNLTLDGTEFDVDDAFITNNAADIMSVSDFGAAAALKIDADQPATTAAEDSKGLWIDYDRTVAISGTNAHNDIGIDLDVNTASLGTSSAIGLDVDVVGATSGTHTSTGMDINVSGSDNNHGLDITVPDVSGDYHIRLFAADDVNDYATFRLKDTGDLEITTVDSAAATGDITITADGDIELATEGNGFVRLDSGTAIYLDSAYSGGSSVYFSQGDTSNYALIGRSNSGVSTNFRLYEGANLGTYDDYFQITSLEHAATTISTVDDNAAAGHITIDPDGELNLTPETEVKSDAPLKIKEAASAVADTAAYGQLWVKTATPNQLYFTTDAGDDIQITSGTSMAGGGSGDMTGVDLTAGTGISIDSETNTTSGDYSATITCNLEGTEVVSTGETGGNKYLREDGDGTCSWQTVSASGNFLADNADDTMAGTLTIDKDYSVATAGTTKGLIVDLDRTGNVSTGVDSVLGLDVDVNVSGGSNIAQNVYGMDIAVTADDMGSGTSNAFGLTLVTTGADNNYGIYNNTANGGIDYMQVSSADTGDYFSMVTTANGATTLATVDDDGATAHLTLDPDGDLIISGADVKIDAGKILYLDGGTDTFIHEASDGVLDITAGGHRMVRMTGTSTGNNANFGTTGVGFVQFEPTYNASDTNVNFNDYGNKAFVTFGSGNIADMNLYFPDVSCNCTLLLKQDGSGSRTVTNWKTFDQADGNESTVVWAGGSAPTLTTTANKLDIISFYWDNDNHKAYGVASLNF